MFGEIKTIYDRKDLDNHKNEDNLKNEDDIKNEDNTMNTTFETELTKSRPGTQTQ